MSAAMRNGAANWIRALAADNRAGTRLHRHAGDDADCLEAIALMLEKAEAERGIAGGMTLRELWSVVEEVVVSMREPMTLKEAQSARQTLTGVLVMQKKREATS